MSDPIEHKEFTHFLNFKNDDTGRIQISEPVKFDASEFNIIQNSDGYARDVTFMNSEIDLEFIKGYFEPAETPYTLPNGIIVDMLGHLLPFILEYYKNFGFESEVEYILERNGVEFILGVLNFEGSETDELTYFKCKVVQDTQRAIIKRRKSIKVDVFSDLNVDGEAIEPLTSEKILLKAKPFTQSSLWGIQGEVGSYQFGTPNDIRYFVNPYNNVIINGIENDLSYLDRGFYTTGSSSDQYIFENRYDMGCIDAKNTLTEGVLNYKDVRVSLYIPTNENIEDNWRLNDYAELFMWAFKTPTQEGNTPSYTSDFTMQNFSSPLMDVQYMGIESYSVPGVFTATNQKRYDLTITDLSIPLPDIENGERLSIILQLTRILTGYVWRSGEQTITYTSTAIDSVIKGVRYIDLLKQAIKSTSGGLETSAPKWEVGGEFYDQFAFSGNLIRQRDDEPFYITYKDRRENLMEVNADCQINPEEAYVGQYNDFYSNVDNGGFFLAPSEEFMSRFNERYAINEFNFKYKNFEKDKDELNTIDAVHTESQWSIANRQVQNSKQINISDIRDPFKIEFQRKKATKDSTALDTDNKISVLDVIEIAPGTLGGFVKNLIHNVDDDGNLQLLNDSSFDWGLLGFNLGDTFIINSDDNEGTYTVIEIERTILKLSGAPSLIGTFLTDVSYPLSDVVYTNRTDEGFSLIENIDNPSNFSNLLYTIRRNMKHWESYINTAASYITQSIRNTFFESNGELLTRFGADGIVYVENEAIKLDTLEPKILTPKIYELPIIVDYEEALNIIKKYEDEATLGGFLRIQNNNGAMIKVYPVKFGYVWQTKVLTLYAEEKSVSDFTTIDKIGSLIVINEVGYDQEILPEIFWDITGDYLLIKDNNTVNIINLTKFDKVKVNGVSFANVEDLAQALTDL